MAGRGAYRGEVRQHGETRDFIFPIPELLRYITAVMTLEPGDMIPTGTLAGVAPMQSGDAAEVSIQGIGSLKNVVGWSIFPAVNILFVIS